MTEKKKGGLSITILLLLFGVIPMFCESLVVFIVATNSISSEISRDVHDKLEASNQEFNLYIQETLIDKLDSDDWEKDYSYVDGLLDNHIVMTVFSGDTRVLTSIKDDKGMRLEGTQASPEVVSAVLENGRHYTSETVKINNETYYVDYLPIRNADGDIVGMSFVGEKAVRVRDTSAGVVRKVLVISLIVEGIVLIIMTALIGIVKKPIIKTTDSLRTISDGKISENFDLHSMIREYRSINSSLGVLQHNLKEAVEIIKHSTDNIWEGVHSVGDVTSSTTNAAEQINTAVGEVALGAQSMAENVQDVNSQVIDMGERITDINSNVRQLSNDSDEMKRVSVSAKDSISKVLSSSQIMIDAINQISEQIVTTNASINKVNEATSLIIDIATQTELLSLNASIESARAGEAGRGFAVVAQSIGELAVQSNDGATSIQAISTEVIENSMKTVELAENIKKLIESEQADILDASGEFDKLGESIEHSLTAIRVVNEDTHDLEKIKEVIVSNVTDLSAISEENAAASEEVSASLESVVVNIESINQHMRQVSDMIENLEKAIEYFK